jgi:hypothetical protein
MSYETLPFEEKEKLRIANIIRARKEGKPFNFYLLEDEKFEYEPVSHCCRPNR